MDLVTTVWLPEDAVTVVAGAAALVDVLLTDVLAPDDTGLTELVVPVGAATFDDAATLVGEATLDDAATFVGVATFVGAATFDEAVAFDGALLDDDPAITEEIPPGLAAFTTLPAPSPSTEVLMSLSVDLAMAPVADSVDPESHPASNITMPVRTLIEVKFNISRIRISFSETNVSCKIIVQRN